jgi:hypothetical protein
MNESQLCEPTQKLHQGDIIRIYNVDKLRHPTLGVIINADCDLENEKLDGVIAYLPIFEFEEYLTKFWLSAYVSQRREASLANIARICNLGSQERLDLVDWLSNDSLQAVIVKTKLTTDALKLNKKDTADVNVELTTLHKCLTVGYDRLEILTYFCELKKPKHIDTAKNMVSEAKKNMGDDHFFLSEIVGENKIGFVIRMRRIYTIEADRCFTSEAELRAKLTGSGTAAGRKARLTPLYQFKVAQMFASQYSRIGLPNEITQLSQLVIDDLAQQFAGDIK